MRRVLAAVLSLTIFPASATDTWSVRESDDKATGYAMNLNRDGLAIVQSCDRSSENCVWRVAIDTSCEAEKKYPGLLTGKDGTAHVTLHCQGTIGTKPYYSYALSAFDDVDRIIRGGGVVGLAFALDSGRFAGLRWNVNGATESLAIMHSNTAEQAKRLTKGQTF